MNTMCADLPGSVGIPMCGDIVSVFDETLHEKQYNEEGEVCIKSESMMLYYYGNKAETERVMRMHSDGSVWIHTGDLGKMNEDGYLFLVGRLSRVISVGNFKISASQIEEVAHTHGAVKEAVAVGVPDDYWGEVVMLFLVIDVEDNQKNEVVIDEVKKICETQLKGKALPKYYYRLDQIPYTSNNKQDYRKLEEEGKKYVESIKNQ